ncbi:iron chaperone [Deinococcus soli (ex Cha et al. 2016)]|uniref:Uncharacterized protein n=1 Tax=Deinococcus soli (ex Cha et al. 2016) TaxID=1309411 RepID=A0A0F7JM96_9DEIO|nr:DUF1801 domain-containing protein [Deinococcus soli (ex Cha et al. 2016)]AKH16499.1 hypothetical protein SY84_04875 [Deinococcus soli (ex Cha et al. 2016)]
MTSRSTRKAQPDDAFSAEERAAMKDRAREVRASRRARPAADGDAEVRARITELPEPERTLARHLHDLIREESPALTPRLWYGMPAYALEGKVVCFYQAAAKFKTRYGTLGFSDAARLDDGVMWPTAYALTSWTPESRAQVQNLILRAVRERQGG